MDRTIEPGQTDTVEISLNTGSRNGKVTRKIRIETNDRKHQNETITCEANVLAAVKTEPRTAHFTKIDRNAGPQKRTITLTRADGGPLAPKIKTVRGDNVTAELREIEAGERYELDITISPPWPNGTTRGNVILETGVEQAPTEGIVVYANVAPRLQAQPQRFTIPADLESNREFRARLVWSGDKPGNISEVVATDPELKARLEDENGKQTIVLEVPAGYSPVRRAGNAVVVKTDDPTARNFRIPMYIMRPGSRRSSPAMRRTPHAEPGKVSNRPVLKTLPAASDKAKTNLTSDKAKPVVTSEKKTPDEQRREREEAAKEQTTREHTGTKPVRQSTGVEAGS